MELFKYTGDVLTVQYYPASGRVRVGVNPFTLMLKRVTEVTAAMFGVDASFAETGRAMRVVCSEIVSMSESVLPVRRRP